jgi:hypothetical protein
MQLISRWTQEGRITHCKWLIDYGELAAIANYVASGFLHIPPNYRSPGEFTFLWGQRTCHPGSLLSSALQQLGLNNTGGFIGLLPTQRVASVHMQVLSQYYTQQEDTLGDVLFHDLFQQLIWWILWGWRGETTSLITLRVLEEHLYNFDSNFVNYVDKQITSYKIVISHFLSSMMDDDARPKSHQDLFANWAMQLRGSNLWQNNN